MNLSFSFLPLIPTTWLLIGYILICAVFLYGAMFRRRFISLTRIVALSVLFIVLINPQTITELRRALPQKLIVVIDESPSQKIDKRHERSGQALGLIEESLKNSGRDIEPVIIRTNGGTAGAAGKEGTALFSALKQALMPFSQSEIAGTVMITDGQVADVPGDDKDIKKAGPLNVVLTGRRDEKDVRVEITSMPKFGLIGGTATIKVKAVSYGEGPMQVSMAQDGKVTQELSFNDGEEKEITVTLAHAGQNAISFSIPPHEEEISTVNNQAVAVIQAIRDRLRVLLVSGAPHMGERAWRNILKSDPAIDLVHFTILRTPQSMDATPSDEMALIPLPVDEIFRNKIGSFDLIILDRYRQYELLPEGYFDNIRRYVEEGGALFLATGTDLPDDQMFMTGLGSILPVKAAGASRIASGDVMPKISEAGQKHPITASLTPQWTAWHGQMVFAADAENTLMTGIDSYPLLTFNEAGKGRIAVLASDNIWQWSKTDSAGKSKGPYMALVGNVIDWLTKEPDMEPGYIKAEMSPDGKIRVFRRASSEPDLSVTMTTPDGEKNEIALSGTMAKGWHTAHIDPALPGLYSFQKGENTAYIVAGKNVQAEYLDLRATPEKLSRIADETGGNILWLDGRTEIDTAFHASADALRLQSLNPYTVLSSSGKRLIPEWLGIVAILVSMMSCWWHEGRKR